MQWNICSSCWSKNNWFLFIHHIWNYILYIII
jgi:hypothetical protein